MTVCVCLCVNGVQGRTRQVLLGWIQDVNVIFRRLGETKASQSVSHCSDYDEEKIQNFLLLSICLFLSELNDSYFYS